MHDIAFLDELQANARPARIQQTLERWRLRASDGITRRANSVLTNGPVPTYCQWFEEIESFYARQGLPARYQISPASPPELDALLEARGYSFDAETSVMVCSTSVLLERAAPNSIVEVGIEESASDAWLADFIDAEGFSGSQLAYYRASFSAIGPRVALARASVAGETAAVGIAVTERGWAGLFSIATAPTFRRRGIGTALVRRLAEWAEAAGAHNLYLQVGAANVPAVTMYERLGFHTLYSYHYRKKALA